MFSGKRFVLFLLVIAGLYNCPAVPAQDQVQFGYVNLAEAVLLHPFMKEYNFVLYQRKNPAYLKLDSGIKIDS